MVTIIHIFMWNLCFNFLCIVSFNFSSIL